MNLIVSPAAAADLRRLRTFLAAQDPDAAQRAIASIVRAIDSLDLFPERGRHSPIAGARELVVPFGRFAYIVRFAYDPQRREIVVLRIWHGREARI